MKFDLNETEKATLEKWLGTRKVKAALKKGAKLSITFTQTSIGVHIEAELDKGLPNSNAVACPPLVKNLTDLESW